MNGDELTAFVAECEREEESCLYTSTTLYMWLRSVRFWRSTFIAAPIILGGFGGWGVLKGLHDPLYMWLAAVCSLLAGLFPAIFKALELDGHVAALTKQAAEFKNMQDRFRQIAKFAPFRPEQESRQAFEELMKRLELARGASVTPPERFFKKAQDKIKSGDYSFDSDAKRK